MRTDQYTGAPTRLITALGGGLIATFIAAGLFGSAAPATAQDGFGNVFGYQSQQRYKRRPVQRSRGPASDNQGAGKTAAKKDKKEEAKKNAPQGAVYAVISLADQHVTVYDATGRIAQSRISTGMPGHPNSDRSLQHHRQGALAPLEHLQRCTDAVHAADHLVGRGHAYGRRARLPGFARLHSAARTPSLSSCGV